MENKKILITDKEEKKTLSPSNEVINVNSDDLPKIEIKDNEQITDKKIENLSIMDYFKDELSKLGSLKSKNEFFYKFLIKNKSNMSNENLIEALQLISMIQKTPDNLMQLLINLYIIIMQKEKSKIKLKFINEKCNNPFFDSLTLSKEFKKEILSYKNEETLLEYMDIINVQLGDNYFVETRTKYILIYLWIATSIKIFDTDNAFDKISILDRTFIKFASNKEELCKRDYLFVSNELSQVKFTSFNKIYSIYYTKDVQLKDLEKKQDILLKINKELNDEKQNLLNKTYLKNVEINKLKSEMVELNKKIECLEKEKDISLGKLDFERNQHESKIDTLRNDIVEDFQGAIKLELDGIEDIIQNIDERSKNKIERRIRRIKKRMERN